jgi:hypothetical protein
VRGETEDAKLKEHQVLQHYNVNINDLIECRRNEPLIDRIKQLENQREKKRENHYLIKKLNAEQIENARLIQEWRMSSSKLAKFLTN